MPAFPSQDTSLNDLFQQAQTDGTLSAEGSNVVNLVDHGANIAAGLGGSVDDVAASQVMVVGVLVDDSTSMDAVITDAQGKSTHVVDVVREEVNNMMAALLGTKQRDGIYVLISALNSGVICPFKPVASVPKLTEANYDANGLTPLYDATVAFLATVVAKLQKFTAAGVQARAVTFILTDGDDVGSKIERPESLAPLVRSILESETHLVLGLGMGKGKFRDTFTRMGLNPKCIRVAGASASEIRQAIGAASQSMVQASQVAPGLAVSQAVAGGFGT